MTRPYDEFVRAAKADADAASPPIDWERVDDRLFQRIAAEKSRLDFERRRRLGWGAGSLAIAAAAAAIWVALSGGGGRDGADWARSLPPQASLAAGIASLGPAVGSVVSIDGAGEIKIDHRTSQMGASLHRGQRLEADRARVVFERVEPSGISYAFEPGARAVVSEALPTLVLALEAGAIEAQVQHVESGDAFAVDVGQARVAVHGTHLRVAREGEFVTVDLSEGVISLGTVDGAREVLVAPVHAEFTASRVRETLRVDRTPGRVRAPVALRRWPDLLARAPVAPVEPSLTLRSPGEAPLRNGVGVRSQLSERLPAPAPPDETPARPVAPPPEVETPKPVRSADPAAEITSGVQRCLAQAVGEGESEVRVSVTTSLQLRISAEGQVQAARFEPAIAPSAMTCASAIIYRAKFSTPGDRSIQIRYTR